MVILQIKSSVDNAVRTPAEREKYRTYVKIKELKSVSLQQVLSSQQYSHDSHKPQMQ